MLAGMLFTLFLTAVLALCSTSNGFEHRSEYDVALVDIITAVPSLENLAVRQNGEILIASTASSWLRQVSPDASHPPIPIAKIPTFTGLLGITELQKDVFYVISSNMTKSVCSNAVWKIDLRNFTVTPSGGIIQPAKISLIQELCTAQLLNGLTRLAPNDTSNLLISDSANGIVYKLNVMTGAYHVVLDKAEFKPLDTGIAVGVNGVHTFNDMLYFTSLDQGIFGRIPISLITGFATGAVEILASNISYGDDFAISPQGTRAWIATNGPQEIVEVHIANKSQRIVASSPFLGSASSVALSYWQARPLLYVTGALDVGVLQNSTRGIVAAIELDNGRF